MTKVDSIKEGDYKIQQISRLLESGGTMLAQHCNVCGAPFFRYHGEILCPVCSTLGDQPQVEQEVESEQPSSQEPVPETTEESSSSEEEPQSTPEPVQAPSEQESSAVPVSAIQTSSPDSGTGSISPSLENLLLLKMEDVAAKMVGEQDVHKVEEWLELIERTVALVERIKKL